MSLIESLETLPGAADPVSLPPALRRAAMLEHPTLAVAAIEKGRIRQANGPWKALFALPPDVSVESHVVTLFPNVASADRFERGIQADRAFDDEGGSSVRAERMLMRRDGTVFLAEIVVSLAGPGELPLWGDAIWQVRDISVERTLRRELRDLEDYHRELLRHQWDMTFVIDRKGRISYASSSIEGALGYRVHAMLGQPFATLLDPTQAAAAEKWLRAASRQQGGRGDSGAGDGFLLNVLHRDGSPRVLACRPRDCFAIPRIAGMVVHARDVGAFGPGPVPDPSVAPDSDGGLAATGEAARLRDALMELARVPPGSAENRIATLLESLCSRLDVAVVTFWQPDDAGEDRVWVPLAFVSALSVDDETPRPPLVSGAPSVDADMPLIIGNVATSTAIDADVAAVLRASALAALVEIPVLGDGRTLGWIAVGASSPRQWPDAEVDFIVGNALLVGLAVGERDRRSPEALEAVELVEAVAVVDTVEAVEAVEIVEAVDTAEAVEIVETVEAVETVAIAPASLSPPSIASAESRDGLTGLPMRLDAERHLAARVASGFDAQPLVALVVDIDRLRDINSGAGLAAGDATIARTAGALVELAGPDGYVARVGGDTFLVVVEGAGPRDVDLLTQSVLDRLVETIGEEADDEPIDVSIGVARHPADAPDAASLLLNADLAMREAKKRGGGQAYAFNQQFAGSFRLRKELDTEIADALQRGEFAIYYQPQVALETGEVVGLEALLRWQHPTWGLMLPEAFIDAVIRRGLIDAVTKMVLVQVCEQIAAWRRAGDPELPVAVNVSGRQFHDRRLPALVASALLKSGLPARLLVLEITEHSLGGDEAGMERVVKELMRLGVRVAIGDFNVGHASLKYLRQLRVSQIKLGSAFVGNLPDDPESATIVSAFVDLAHRLNYQVVAEGVETRGQFDYLRSIGCEWAQGFYIGAPLSAAEIRSHLESNRKSPLL